jgi:molybdate transport system substrate-binding protein
MCVHVGETVGRRGIVGSRLRLHRTKDAQPAVALEMWDLGPPWPGEQPMACAAFVVARVMLAVDPMPREGSSMGIRLRTTILVAGALALATVLPVRAGETNVAVAANFTDAANEIAEIFKEKTGHEAILSFGSTGQLYTQITQAAPFEVFLAADDERPRKAVEEGFGVSGSQFTYAIGTLVLWSQDAELVQGERTLKDGDFTKIAIANPEAAPYGAAAVQAMTALGVYDQLEPKIVQGNNISQTLQFVETGNAELGFIALAQVARDDDGSRWVVPEDLHDPIRQDAVLLKTGEDSEAAQAFVEFLNGPEAAAIIKDFGYGTDASS